MATQSLYRRYRPRRFSEVKGQDHVVRALRNAVIHGREGQAYLFSGPRGTGKTTSARILAKVLNCRNPIDGEPCCECESCIAVERGASYDVHELDAASNNGVDAMRDLIEKAALGTPGRHKVYILDEVHMLSKAAEAALLKTLEEPPPHVVFVLATTDPQKVSETIRSRTQHLTFHLLSMDVLEDHIRWLAGDAGIELNEAALESVLVQGGGSARDTVSALELVAAGGGIALESVPMDEFIEALIEHDPGRALTVVAHAMGNGRDVRSLTDDLIRHLRDCFLSLMAPELVQLTSARQTEVADLAQRVGAATLVRAMERLGEMIVEMRHAPDPRLLLEVALVQLTHRPTQVDLATLVERIDRLERTVAAGAVAAAPAPTDPTTGRAVLGGRAARREPSGAQHAAVASPPATAEPATTPPATAGPSVGAEDATMHPVNLAAAPSGPSSTASDPSPAPATIRPTPAPPDSQPAQPAVAASPSASPSVSDGDLAARAAKIWASEILPALRGLAKPMYAGTTVLGGEGSTLRIAAPNEPHRQRCDDCRGDVERVIQGLLGGAVTISLSVRNSNDPDDLPIGSSNVIAMRPAAVAESTDDDEDIDLDELVDVPPDDVISPVDRLH
ncbi:MAG TPA: DNA polymerase III subunit gamma/tau, partial [Ilumatobacteraceae bacterium]|nr:DNA polymerase III subunit gamma/tau [Ilumatobacteraceae bacterium]